jgi:hydroxypyruvate isomerase
MRDEPTSTTGFVSARPGLSRRSLLQSTVATAGLTLFSGRSKAAETLEQSERVITRGRIRQSIMGWCFKPMSAEELAGHCKSIGLVAMEGISPASYPRVRELGLEISLVGSHGFRDGPFNRDNLENCVAKLRESIDLAVSVGCPSVITFTGMREAGISDKQGIENCLECWRRVIPYAEEKKINLCLEHLNSRDDTHPMKGHPGYFGDDVDLCVDLIKRVDSPRMKLLFDIYHVQIMNGDVIRRIRQYSDVIGHYHTAGVPGRGELDDTQEINYPAVMKAIVESGYTGYVAHEFIPTWSDRLEGLRQAARLCDV